MTEGAMLSDATRSVATNLDIGPSDRLWAMLAELGKGKARKWRKAGKRAARALELQVPAIIGMTTSGLVSGLFSMVPPSRGIAVLASPASCVGFDFSLNDLPDAIEAADIARAEHPDLFTSDSVGIAAITYQTLELALEHGEPTASPASIGLLLGRSPVRAEFMVRMNTLGVTPALVVLLDKAEPPLQSVTVILALGRHIPLDMVPTEGKA